MLFIVVLLIVEHFVLGAILTACALDWRHKIPGILLGVAVMMVGVVLSVYAPDIILGMEMRIC